MIVIAYVVGMMVTFAIVLWVVEDRDLKDPPVGMIAMVTIMWLPTWLYTILKVSITDQ